jgi:hypothetical protein
MHPDGAGFLRKKTFGMESSASRVAAAKWNSFGAVRNGFRESEPYVR